MLAKPDPSTFQILPWRGETPATARMFCDIAMPDGSPSYADPRYVLKRTLAKAADVLLLMPKVTEACPLGLAPTTSRLTRCRWSLPSHMTAALPCM